MTTAPPRSIPPADPRATLRAGLPDRYLTPTDVAALLRVPLETVYQWRKKRTGPPGFRVGKHLRYDPAALHHWITEQSTREAA
ncbi:helix-turn-helix domain-containing protein [Streptomyces sp. H27-D2]|uniref:helix-turn-helix domain-containing protein n=1 Tax=Streptomyces sp. H27-D2 TaxID=3046304 RepID=UPI002DB5C4C4|nr:helix-turn-helix domain-containing protein [Streptomyces sp. H27-D2]MEC4015232.1 helix-turn-helix domain-containing protein [Streptomyces sp. H27-D2]